VTSDSVQIQEWVSTGHSKKLHLVTNAGQSQILHQCRTFKVFISAPFTVLALHMQLYIQIYNLHQMQDTNARFLQSNQDLRTPPDYYITKTVPIPIGEAGRRIC
jgi:hypothetical protein